MDMSISASIVITTKNRKDDLRQALRSALTQNVDVEVLVLDDASTDGTEMMVQQEFPDVRFLRFDTSEGYIVRRNQVVRMARAPIVFIIDDDACFSTKGVVGQTLADFSDPRIGAVAIPYVDVGYSTSVHQRAPATDSIYLAPFYRGTAHALRRDMFLQLGGYWELLVHQEEEIELALRMLESGFLIRCGTSEPVLHHASPVRSISRMDYYGRRNRLLVMWRNFPLRACLWRGAGVVAVTVCKYLVRQCSGKAIRGIGDAMSAIVAGKVPRAPVRKQTYAKYVRLKSKPMATLQSMVEEA